MKHPTNQTPPQREFTAPRAYMKRAVRAFAVYNGAPPSAAQRSALAFFAHPSRNWTKEGA